MTRHLIADARTARVAGSQFAVITLEQALACGLTWDQVRERTRSGRWERMFRGVYRLAGAPRCWQQDVIAACFAGPKGIVASHVSAAALFRLLPASLLPHLTVPRGASCRLPNARVHLAAPFDRLDRTMVGRIPCTAAARTILDCSTLLGRPELTDMVDDAFCRGLSDAERVAAAIDRAQAAPGRKGVPLLREVMEAWTPGIAPDSPAEMRLLRLLVEWGFEPPERQVEVRDATGALVGRVDLGWPDRRIGVEYDSRRWHSPRRWEHDERRHQRFEAAGWWIRHADNRDLQPGATRLADSLRAAFARRPRAS